MNDHTQAVKALQVLARNALAMAMQLTDAEHARIKLEAYKSPRKGSNDRSDFQQEWCDIQTAWEDATRRLEAMGFTDIKKRYEDG